MSALDQLDSCPSVGFCNLVFTLAYMLCNHLPCPGCHNPQCMSPHLLKLQLARETVPHCFTCKDNDAKSSNALYLS